MRKVFGVLWLLVACAACDEPADGPSAPDTIELTAAGPTTPRLTQDQYRRSVQALLGDDIEMPVALEPDSRASGFLAAGASRTTISSRGVEQYEAAAYQLAAQAFSSPERRARVVPCSETTDACRDEFLVSVARRLWRRSASQEELERLRAVASQAHTTLGEFDDGLEFALAAMLQSPNFLFRVDRMDPTGLLDGPSLASRLSFFLWNAPPDEALLELAESGALLEDATLAAEVDRMLADPRARSGVRQFFSDMYELDRLDGLTKAPELFPHISDDFGPSAREETLRVIEALAFERADFRDLLTTRRTFLNRKMAAIYDVAAPTREGFGAYEFDEASMRRGILGHASFLALWAHPVSTSATLRGMYIQQKLLCRVIPPPPAGVDTSIPEPTGDNPTLRDRIAEHLEVESCATCHRLTDPVGLAFENFDGIGRFRTTDDGVQVDTSGTFDGVPFDDPVELAAALRASESFGACVAQRLASYATSHAEFAGDKQEIAALGKAFAATGHDLLALMKLIALSDGFRRVNKEAEP